MKIYPVKSKHAEKNKTVLQKWKVSLRRIQDQIEQTPLPSFTWWVLFPLFSRWGPTPLPKSGHLVHPCNPAHCQPLVCRGLGLSIPVVSCNLNHGNTKNRSFSLGWWFLQFQSKEGFTLIQTIFVRFYFVPLMPVCPWIWKQQLNKFWVSLGNWALTNGMVCCWKWPSLRPDK